MSAEFWNIPCSIFHLAPPVSLRTEPRLVPDRSRLQAAHLDLKLSETSSCSSWSNSSCFWEDWKHPGEETRFLLVSSRSNNNSRVEDFLRGRTVHCDWFNLGWSMLSPTHWTPTLAPPPHPGIKGLISDYFCSCNTSDQLKRSARASAWFCWMIAAEPNIL